MRGERDRRDRDGERGREREERDKRDDRRSSNASSNAPPLKRLKSSQSSAESSQSSARKDTTSKQQVTDGHVVTPKYDVLQVTLEAIRKEEEQAIATDPAEDLEKFRSTCAAIRDVCDCVAKLKGKNETDKIDELKKKGSLLFLKLKALNRYDKYRSKDAKDRLQSVRQKVDSHHLRLQNLLYEVMHLQKERKTCETFKSKDEDIDLVAMEKFLAEAPADLAKPDLDSHSMHLARLEWELCQRKELEKQLKSAESIKKTCEEEIAGRRESLDKLQPTLKSVVESAQPLYTQLNMPLQAHDEAHANAEYLPRALFVLYVEMIAYKHASKGKFDVRINGNVEDAKAMALNAADNKEEEEEKDERDEEEHGRKSKKSRHRQKSIAATRTTGLKKLTATHPMSVIFTIDSLDKQLVCQFNYLLKLEIVTVKVSVQQRDTTHNEVVSGNLLSRLFNDSDDGQISPNPANDYLINSYGVENFSCLIDEVGHAYQWAQKLAGLEFIGVDVKQQQECNKMLSISWMDQTIKNITDRFHSRLLLQQQLRELRKGIVLLPVEIKAVTCKQVDSSIKEFAFISANAVFQQELSKNVHLQEAIDLEVVNLNESFVYQTRLENGSAALTALVIIPIDYPKNPPFFYPTINWNGTERKSDSDSALRDLEELVNVKCPSQMPDSMAHQLLSYCMHTLQVAFDVYLESHSSSLSESEGPKEFSQKKMFAQFTAGRDHAKPYNYDKHRNTFIV